MRKILESPSLEDGKTVPHETTTVEQADEKVSDAGATTKQHYVLTSSGPEYVDGDYDKDGLVESAIRAARDYEWPNKAAANKFLHEVAAKFGISPTIMASLFRTDSDPADVIAQMSDFMAVPVSETPEIDAGVVVNSPVWTPDEEDDGSSDEDEDEGGEEW